MNKVRVTICGKEFALKTEESPSYYITLAKKVDKTIDEMTAASDKVTVQTAAILAALAAFDEAEKANESIDNIRAQIKEYVSEASKSRMERDDALRDAESLKARIAILENELCLARMKHNIDHTINEETDKELAAVAAAAQRKNKNHHGKDNKQHDIQSLAANSTEEIKEN